MEQFYIVDIQDLQDPADDPQILQSLPPERRMKCLRYRKSDDRKRSCGAGIIIQKILQGAEYEPGPHGKPQSPNVQFSISHAGRFVIGVQSGAQIGCDIEYMRSPRWKVAEHYFSDRQIRYIRQWEQEEEQKAAFWRIWTLSESYMKMTGEGMSLSLRSFEVVIHENENGSAVSEEGTFSQQNGILLENCLSGAANRIVPLADSIQVYREGNLQQCELQSFLYKEHMIGLCRNTGNFSHIPV